jgi:S-adenosylmethionine:tRNA ribosyltransferase-isomerase
VKTSDFAYSLPPDRIAQEPAARGASRLMVVDKRGTPRHRHVVDLSELLQPTDLVVVNDTRVIPARLLGRTLAPSGSAAGTEGGAVEIFLVERLARCDWICLSRPGRRTRPGTRLVFEDGLTAEVVARHDDGRVMVRFAEPVDTHLDRIGHVPLPPYINRPDTPADRERYQTVYARHPGAVAAPTAGLHLSEGLLAAFTARGIEMARVTLHVGLGTFRPVTAENLADHTMDTERYAIGAEAAAAVARARDAGRRIVAIGTTVVRTLEGAAAAHGGDVPTGAGSTNIFITPGFEFQIVDVLMTNFHLPCSTLLMLVCAFAGKERILAAYDEAVSENYRFYSYGDAMLVARRAERPTRWP